MSAPPAIPVGVPWNLWLARMGVDSRTIDLDAAAPSADRFVYLADDLRRSRRPFPISSVMFIATHANTAPGTAVRYRPTRGGWVRNLRNDSGNYCRVRTLTNAEVEANPLNVAAGQVETYPLDLPLSDQSKIEAGVMTAAPNVGYNLGNLQSIEEGFWVSVGRTLEMHIVGAINVSAIVEEPIA